MKSKILSKMSMKTSVVIASLLALLSSCSEPFGPAAPPIVEYTLTLVRNPAYEGGISTSINGHYGRAVDICRGVPASIYAKSSNANYEFVDWTMEIGSAKISSSTSASTTVTLTSDATIRANFRLVSR